jgi:hypothetical protein
MSIFEIILTLDYELPARKKLDVGSSVCGGSN